MTLTREQRLDASRHQRAGRLLREIAGLIGASYEDVCLYLYGGIADWAPRSTAARKDVHRSSAADGSADSHEIEEPGAPVGPAEEAGDGNGLRLKGEAAAKVDGAATGPGVGARESGTLAAGGIIRCGDDAPPPAPRPYTREGAPAGAAAMRQSDAQSSAAAIREGAVAAAPVPAAPLFRLTNGAGEYLHKSGTGMTRNRDAAWQGDARQMEEAFRRKPHLKELDAEPAGRVNTELKSTAGAS